MKPKFSTALISLIGIIVFQLSFNQCKPKFIHEPPGRPTIDTVTLGSFSEYIPAIGIVKIDARVKSGKCVVVEIDQLYFGKISTGLKASAELNNHVFWLRVDKVNGEMSNGRFKTSLVFQDNSPGMNDGQSLRIRIQLSEPSMELLLPIGDFYSYTMGEWIFVLDSGNIAKRRSIRLGRKMGSQFFEVLEGLKVGDRVITSHYEGFSDRNSIRLDEVIELYDR